MAATRCQNIRAASSEGYVRNMEAPSAPTPLLSRNIHTYIHTYRVCGLCTHTTQGKAVLLLRGKGTRGVTQPALQLAGGGLRTPASMELQLSS